VAAVTSVSAVVAPAATTSVIAATAPTAWRKPGLSTLRTTRFGSDNERKDQCYDRDARRNADADLKPNRHDLTLHPERMRRED
jgi:hypothetical protein